MVEVTFIADVNEPDLYNDVKDLTDPFNLNIVISITNTYSATLYFQASLDTPPEGYTNTTANLGSIAAGANAIFTFSPARVQPSLTTGEYDEELTIKIEAFTDSGYSSSAGSQTLVQDIYHFDHTDVSWTAIYHGTFDGNNMDGWTETAGNIEGYTYRNVRAFITPISTTYLTPFYSLQANRVTNGPNEYTAKSFDTSGKTKARFVMHYYTASNTDGELSLTINSLVKKSAVIKTPNNRWVRFAFSVPIGASVPVAFACVTPGDQYPTLTHCVDEIWVIAK